MSTEVNTYTLEGAVTNAKVTAMIRDIIDDQLASGDTRVKVVVDGCELLCNDEREREVHGDKVTAAEALACLTCLISTS